MGCFFFWRVCEPTPFSLSDEPMCRAHVWRRHGVGGAAACVLVCTHGKGEEKVGTLHYSFPLPLLLTPSLTARAGPFSSPHGFHTRHGR